MNFNSRNLLLGFLLACQVSAQAQVNTDNIDIVRDRWGVPHIFGKTDAEVAYGLAWATCEDDFETVQKLLLAVRGRLGEVTGKNGAMLDFMGKIARIDEAVELLETLQGGRKYRVEFYLSSQDSVNYAVKNVGMHLSSTSPISDIDSLFSLVPQIRYSEDEFLNEKNGWMKVAGSFVAEGGEKYIIIGNFDIDFSTEISFVAGGGSTVNHPSEYWDVSSYFIDDVSVVADTVTGIGEVGETNWRLEVYPNPATGSITVEVGRQKDAALELFDAMGRSVLRRKVSGHKETMSIGHLPKGVYMMVLYDRGTVVARRKLVVKAP